VWKVEGMQKGEGEFGPATEDGGKLMYCGVQDKQFK
jgi:hypothetical protein